jgi:hypothetical protein
MNTGNDLKKQCCEDSEEWAGSGTIIATEDDDDGIDSELQFRAEFSEAVLQLAMDRFLREEATQVNNFVKWIREAPTKIVRRGRAGDGSSIRTGYRATAAKAKIEAVAAECVPLNNFVGRRAPRAMDIAEEAVDEDAMSDVDDLEVDDGRVAEQAYLCPGSGAINTE